MNIMQMIPHRFLFGVLMCLWTRSCVVTCPVQWEPSRPASSWAPPQRHTQTTTRRKGTEDEKFLVKEKESLVFPFPLRLSTSSPRHSDHEVLCFVLRTLQTVRAPSWRNLLWVSDSSTKTCPAFMSTLPLSVWVVVLCVWCFMCEQSLIRQDLYSA